MIIAQISDTHIAFDTPDREQRLQDFAAVVADINALDPAPDVIIHSGDIVHNGREDEYAQAREVLSQARAPVYVMVGNKDNRANLRAVFSDHAYFPQDADFIDYAINDFPVRLVALDTLDPTSNKGDFCAQRLERAERLMNSAPEKPVAVFTHHPLFEVDVGPEPVHFGSVDVMNAAAHVLQKSGRVIALFCGHVHRSTFGTAGAIPALVATAVATPLRRGDYGETVKDRPVYLLHRYDPAWGFATETRIV